MCLCVCKPNLVKHFVFGVVFWFCARAKPFKMKPCLATHTEPRGMDEQAEPTFIPVHSTPSRDAALATSSMHDNAAASPIIRPAPQAEVSVLLTPGTKELDSQGTPGSSRLDIKCVSYCCL